MKNVKLIDSHKEPYPHDYAIDKVFLWMFPKGVVKPNHLTIFRFLATPFVLFLVVREDWLLAIPIFVLVACTDVLDGTMARMRGQITAWGTLFDPIADKLLIGGVLFILIIKYVNIFIGGAIIVLELAVIIGGWLKMNHGIIVSAGKWGKTKMFLQAIGVGLILLSLFLSNPAIMLIAEWTLVLSIGFAILNIFNKGWIA